MKLGVTHRILAQIETYYNSENRPISLVLEADIHNPSKKSCYKSKEHYLEERKSVQEIPAKKQDIVTENLTPSTNHEEEEKLNEDRNEDQKEPMKDCSEEKELNNQTIKPENDIIPENEIQNNPHSRRSLLEALFIEKKDIKLSESKSLDDDVSLLTAVKSQRRKLSLDDSQPFEDDTCVKVQNRAALTKNFAISIPQLIQTQKLDALDLASNEKTVTLGDPNHIDPQMIENPELITSKDSDPPTCKSSEEGHLQMNKPKVEETKHWAHTRKRSNSFSNATITSLSHPNRERFLSDQLSPKSNALSTLKDQREIAEENIIEGQIEHASPIKYFSIFLI